MSTILVNISTKGATFNHPKRKPLYFSFASQDFTQFFDTTTVEKSYTANELIGFIPLHNVTLCVLATSFPCAEVFNCMIRKVEKIEVIPLPELDDKQLQKQYGKSDLKLQQRIQKMFDDFELYYSHDVNITLTQQSLYKDSSYVDKRFFWNQNMVAALPSEWVTIFVDGFVASTVVDKVKYTLISRRDCSRTGLRFSSRGGDINGNVSNFVETEQIVETHDVITSFVQVRGNIPLIWKTNEEDKFSPKGKFYPTIYQDWCVANHFESMNKLYGDVLAVNLLDNHGAEKELHDMYGFYIGLNAPQVKYFAFDFHKECANSKYENVENLIATISSELVKQNCFVRNGKNEVTQIQRGVVRTNCIDCLDRTNVVQSSIAKQILSTQCMALNDEITFCDEIKNIWADHANVMSKRYTGTNAMKTDYTRSGKRGIKGMMSDGKTSIQRTMISIQTDQYQTPQETLDLLLGKTRIAESENCESVVLCIPLAYENDTSMKESQTRKVHIHVTKKAVKVYYDETGICWEVLLSDVVACEATHDFDKVVFYTKKTSLPRKVQIGDRDKMFSLLNEVSKFKSKSRPITLRKGPVVDWSNKSNRVIEHKVDHRIEVSMINWNMEFVESEPDEQMIKNCVKNNQKDIVVVSVNKCSYQTQENIFDSVFDFFQKVSVELNKSGEIYVLVSVHHTSDVAQCVFVKKVKYWKIHSVEVSNVFYEKSRPIKYTTLKSVGSAIFMKINETSVGFLVLEEYEKSEEKGLYVKNIDLRSEVNELFISVFDSRDEIPGLEKAIRKTKIVRKNGSVFQRSVFDLSEDTDTTTEIVLSEGKENCVRVKPSPLFCLGSRFSIVENDKEDFIQKYVFKVENIEALFETKVGSEKGVQLELVSSVLTQTVTTTSPPSKNKKACFLNILLSLFCGDIDVKKKWITALFFEKDVEVGRAIVPLNYLLQKTQEGKCPIYSEKQKIGDFLFAVQRT
ncbi:suppressor of actin, putative [Entamoeba invadens IP1]|uniref:Suppressor of actin, putative n=1 Tax=Entamoeba invadens IP1 TaxID=370355 RepID=A0A0A1U7J0_ENTIV|nr:suppressor of actin, putative [Entamoeba invadens IP1]ELP90359.1 suppressor of actin, putative [Entamoeba invadens IP1]|eukprot:XP_004257130.1 suppressor of actin, putative [Entamoeba invadens IP1]